MLTDNSKADIVIADDHKLFRKGLRALLEGFSSVGKVYEVTNGAELIKFLSVSENIPDLVFLDIRMPVMDGIEAHKRIRTRYPNLKVVILSMEDDEQFILHLIMEGVNGYLLKDSDPEELETAILKLMKNDFYFPAEASQLILKNTRKKSFLLNEQPHLTKKELLILEYLCKEYTAAEIAEMAGISVRTVEGHKSRLLEKTGARNSAGLVVYALKHKLVLL